MNLFRRLSDKIIFENYFIALCAVSMVLTTYLLNNIPLHLNVITVFIFFSTFLLYNFHRISYHLNYSSVNNLINSVINFQLTLFQKITYSIALISLITASLFLRYNIYIYLTPLVLLALAYSIPVIRLSGKFVRLREVYLIKTFSLAVVWGLVTSIIPLADQNIRTATPFVVLQTISRTLFIFALCIPFEIRDVQTDSLRNVRTLPVIIGIRKTKIVGVVVIILEIITHHLMVPSISLNAAVSLDISSVPAMMWIIFDRPSAGKYHYKFLVDGTMIFRFLLLLPAILTYEAIR